MTDEQRQRVDVQRTQMLLMGVPQQVADAWRAAALLALVKRPGEEGK